MKGIYFGYVRSWQYDLNVKYDLPLPFLKNLSSQTQPKVSPRSDERVAHFWKQIVHLSMSQHKGFCAFFRKSAASETLKSAIVPRTNLEETF